MAISPLTNEQSSKMKVSKHPPVLTIFASPKFVFCEGKQVWRLGHGAGPMSHSLIPRWKSRRDAMRLPDVTTLLGRLRCGVPFARVFLGNPPKRGFPVASPQNRKHGAPSHKSTHTHMSLLDQRRDGRRFLRGGHGMNTPRDAKDLENIFSNVVRIASGPPPAWIRF